MYTILHNNRCGKSREAIKILEENNVEFTIREYLKDPLDSEELEKLTKKLNLSPIDIVRQKESIWIENYKNVIMSDKDLLNVLSENPKLIERPIIFDQNSGIIGRPTEKILDYIIKGS